MNIFSNIGITELIVILLLALLVVGPERLPELARQLAKLLRDVRTAYENLTKDLGPELMSLEQSTREIRESVNSVRSIPKDMVGSVVKAAELEDTVSELKGVQKSVDETGKSVSQAARMIRQPLGETLKTARGALDPGKAKDQTDVPSATPEPGAAEQAAPETGEMEQAPGRSEAGSPGEPTPPAVADNETSNEPAREAAEDERASD